MVALCGGCSLPLNESPPETKPLDVKVLGEASGCLSRVMPVVETYFEGEAQDAQVDATWNCMSKAVETFQDSVRGRYEDRFTSREVAHFIEQYFLEDNKRLSKSLVEEIFGIKQLFVGGAIDSISRQEMNNLRTVIQELKRLTLRLNPYMKVYAFKWQVDHNSRDVASTTDHFEAANQNIQQAAKDLAILIEKNGLPYRLDRLVNLLKEAQVFSSSGGWGWIADVEKAMPLLKKIKSALSGGSPDEIAPTEWRRFALLGARGYVQYLRYHYFIKSQDLTAGGSTIYYFTRSIDDLFSYLGDMVEGKPNQMLTRQELVDILQSLATLVPELKVSDALVQEIMKIKVVFFGGRVDFFVKADFDRARGKLTDFQELTERFLKYTDVYGLSWKPDALPPAQAQDYFRLAEANLDEFASRLGKNMEDAYDLQNAVLLAEEIDHLYPNSDPSKESLAATVKKFVPTIVAVKNIQFNDHNSVIGGAHSTLTPMQQWSEFLGLVAKVYSRYMYYDYFLADKSWTDNLGIENFNRLVSESVDIIDGWIAKRQTAYISFTELSQLWTAALKTGFLPKKMTVETLDGLTKVLVQKMMLPPEDRLAGRLPLGFSKVTTKTLRTEFAMWVENERFLNVMYKNIPDAQGKPGPELLADLDAGAQSSVAIKELQMAFKSPVPLSFDAAGRIYLSKPAKNYLRQTADLTNLIRAAVRIVVRAYAADQIRINQYDGINQAEANLLLNDLKPIVTQMNLISPQDVDFADNRFRDANLFTPIGNGDLLADFRELNQLFLMIWSGLEIDGLMYDKMTPVCAVVKPTDYKDDWTADLTCVMNFYEKEMPAAFESMPDYMKFQASFDHAKFQSVFMNLLKAAGHSEKGTGKVHIGDLSLVPHVIQYIETLFQGFDADRSGTLNTPEALVAFPTYKPILQQVSGLKTDKELKGLFTWMLKYGKPPQSGAEKIKFATWWVPQGENGWKIDADREKLAAILGFIAEATEAAKPTPGGEAGAGAADGAADGAGAQP